MLNENFDELSLRNAVACGGNAVNALFDSGRNIVVRRKNTCGGAGGIDESGIEINRTLDALGKIYSVIVGGAFFDFCRIMFYNLQSAGEQTGPAGNPVRRSCEVIAHGGRG